MPTEYTDPIELTSLPQLVRAVNTKAGYLPSNVVDATYTQIQVATPTFNPTSSTTPYPVAVTISCATSGVGILYSIDGSEPSLTYTGPVAVSSNTPLKAKATKTNYLTSDVGSAVYNQAQVPVVTFSPSSSAVVFPQTVYLATTLGDADIYYTIGSNPPEPTTSDILYNPSTGVVVNSAVTIKAFGVKTGYLPGSTTSATYTQVQVATPTFSQSYSAGGGYWYPNTITLSCSTSGASIYYTVDGSTPTTSSTLYTTPFDISASTTVKALAVKTGYLNSAVGSRLYDQQRVTTTPTISQNNSESGIPGATAALYPTVVTFTGEAGATFRYTVDGSTPDGSSTLYSAPFNNLSAATIKVKSFKTNYVDSAVTTQSYTQRVVVAPTFSHPGGEIVLGSTVSISTTTPGCSIYYTTNGTTPTNSSTLYTGPITISTAQTVKAIAYKTSGFQYASWGVSTVTSASYIGPLAPVPTITPNGSGAYEFPVRVVLAAAGADAIYYTTDGSTPDSGSTLFVAPYFIITDTTTIKAIGTKAGYSNSAVVAATITKAVSQRRGVATPVSGTAVPDNQAIAIVGGHDLGSGVVSGVTHGTNNAVYSVLQLRSGKMLIMGAFTSINGVTRSRVARVFPEYGVTDTTFIDAATSPATGGIHYIKNAVELPDGSLILVGAFSTYQGITRNLIAKISADGVLDTTFTAAIGGSGYNGSWPVATHVAYYNNKIYVAGNFSTVTPTGGTTVTSRNYVVLNLDGTLNTASSLPQMYYLEAMAVDYNGRLLLQPSISGQGAVRRYLTDNVTVDSTFSSAAFTAGSTNIYKILPLPSGKTLVAGGIFTAGWSGNNDYWALVRLNSDGSLDNTFTKYGHSEAAISVAVDLDGYAYLGFATANAYNSVRKIDTSGSLVSTFSANFNATTNGLISTADITLDQGNRLVVGIGQQAAWHTIDGSGKPQTGVIKVQTDGNLYRGLYGNNIKFTLNGTTPTTSSSDWPGSLNINQESEVFPTIKTKIRSIPAGGFELGTMDTFNYTWLQVATPTATPAAGTIGFGSTVALSCSTSGASIYYTVDGSTPDNSSTLYTAPITVNTAVTIKAIAYKADYKTSAVLTAAYTQATVATPTATPTGSAVVFGSTVALSCSTSGASIYYTVDGSSPALVTRVPTMTGNTTSGFTASASSNATSFDPYLVFDVDDGTSWLAGTGQLVPQWVRVQMPTAQTIIAYAVTADTYVGAPKDFKLQGSNNGSSWTDLNTQTGITWSGLLRKQYTISSPANYSYYRLYISAVQDNAYEPAVIGLELLRYGLTYSSALTINSAQTIKAIGVKTGFINSSIMSEAYTQAQVATPTATPVGGAIPYPTTITLSCSTSGASIYYTVNGSTPTTSSTLYGIGGFAIVPTMSSDTYTAIDGDYISSASGTLGSGYQPYLAFDSSSGGNLATIWGMQNNDVWPVWLKIELPIAHTVSAYKVGNGHGSTTYYARIWQFQGSNDNSTWTTLDSQSLTLPWNGALTTFTLGSPGSYRWYRLLISANNGSTLVTSVGVFQLISSTTIPTINADTTLKAIGVKANYANSGVMSEAYTQSQLANVVFNPVDGTSGVSLVTLTNAVSGATIRYTINGSTPTSSNGFTYSGPIGIVAPKTVKAYAYKTGYIDSNVSTATYP